MKTLKIHNFGPVHDATIDIKRFNLFIGVQSVGKSTIAKLIAIFTDYLSLILLCDNKVNNVWDSILESFDLHMYAQNSNYTIEYSDVTESLSITLKITQKGLKAKVVENGSVKKSSKSIFSAIISQKTIYHAEQLTSDKLLSMEELKKLLTENIRNSIYIPAERIVASLTNKLLSALMLIKEQVPNNLLRFVTELNNAKSKYSDFNIGLLNVKYKFENGNEFVKLENDELLPLQNASSGMQSVIPLILTLKYAKENRQYESYVVEEPECNLFPQKQIELLEILLSELYSADRFLTITTHSPYLLSAMNNYLYAHKLSMKFDDETKAELRSIVNNNLWVDANECSIYSLGEDINEGVYCKDIKDPVSGLIDYNYLDGVSLEMSDKFSKMQRFMVKELRKSRKQ